jgi:hypothetical protein
MVVFGRNQVWSSFGFDLNFKFSRVSFSPWRALAVALLLSPAATFAVGRCTASTAATCYSRCRRTRARVSAQVSGTAQGHSRHLSARAPRHCNWQPHTEPLPYTHLHQAIECVASPSRSCFTHYRAAPFFSPRASAHSSFLCRHCRRAHLVVASPLHRTRAATKGLDGSALAPRCFPTQPRRRSSSEPAAFQLFPVGCEQYHRRPLIKIHRLR